ncbi:hypothetical protein AB0J69_58115, partial [Nonomuraea sp. NPDC049709]
MNYRGQRVSREAWSASATMLGGRMNPVAVIAVALALVVLALPATGFLRRKSRILSRRAELKRVLAAVEEDITSFGEELDQLDFPPGEPEADEDMRADMIQALDSYETAKRTVTRV